MTIEVKYILSIARLATILVTMVNQRCRRLPVAAVMTGGYSAIGDAECRN